MRVKLEKNYKDFYTLSDLDRAKAIIAYEKDDEMSAKEWTEYAVREALKDDPYNNFVETLKAEAHTAKNCRAWNRYNEDSADMDIWIDAIAETSEGFIRVGFYLSDAWETGATSYKHRMHIVNYEKKS